MARLFSGTVSSRHPGNAFRLSVKEQDSGRTAQYSRLRHLLSIRCLHTVSGTEAHQYRYPFHTGTADTDRRNDCFCRYLCISVLKKREKGKSRKLKTNPILFSQNGVYLSISFGTRKKNSTHKIELEILSISIFSILQTVSFFLFYYLRFIRMCFR